MGLSLIDTARLWLGGSSGLQTRFFRRTLELSKLPCEASIGIFAEQRYHLWINGEYLGRGPAFHHPTVHKVDSYDITNKLRPGKNVVAVLVQAADVPMHNHIPTGYPGLKVMIHVDEDLLKADDQWRVTDRNGWRSDSPRRSWAVDYVEEFEMANATLGWQAIDVDDSGWPKAEVLSPGVGSVIPPDAQRLPPPLPLLRSEIVLPLKFTGAFAMSPVEPGRPTGSGALGTSIQNAVKALLPIRLPDNGKAFTVEGDVMICFDLGREYVGQVIFEAEFPGEGVVDIGYSEVVAHGRPVLVRKGVGYVDRVYATKGSLRWEPIQFSGFRYVCLTFRGFSGPVKVKQIAARATEPDVQWPGHFESSDPALNAIFEMCALTQRIGTQNGQMDCPTREQAPYIGDGVLTARWFAQLTGDTRHYQYIIREQFRRQASNGLLRSAIFSGSNDTIVDYTLLAVIAVRDYVRYTGDRDFHAAFWDRCHRAFRFFDSHREAGGLCTWTMNTRPGIPWEKVYDPARPQLGEEQGHILFIDHPGLGWHNKNEAGIDRRGTSAALNALIVLATRAMAEIDDIAGETVRAKARRADAAQLAARIRDTFFDATRGVFVDGVLDGRQLQQVSEQTNTWCIAARCCDDDTARAILTRLLTSDDPFVSRNGPYFWAYLYPELARLGLHQLALDHTRALWGQMLDGGATTLWETFLGDDLDSWCHPWSGAPLEFLLTHVLGLPGHDFDPANIVLRPRTDLLPRAKGSIYTRLGWFGIEWDGGKVSFTAPPGVKASIQAIDV